MQGQNLANPTSMLASGVLLLRHVGLDSHADQISNALLAVLKDGTVKTRDIGGNSSTTDFTKAVFAKLQQC